MVGSGDPLTSGSHAQPSASAAPASGFFFAGSPLFGIGYVLVTILLGWWAIFTIRVVRRSRELSTEINRLQVLSKQKSDFLAFMCHELRNPLHAIIATCNMSAVESGQRRNSPPPSKLAAAPGPTSGGASGDFRVDSTSVIGGGVASPPVLVPAARPPSPPPRSPSPVSDESSDMKTIADAADSMRHIVDDILDLGKMEASRLDLEVIPFDIRTVCAQVQNLFCHISNAKGVALNVSIEEPVAGTLFGDPHRIRQILTNLVSNALKFTHSGGTVTLAIRMFCGTKCIVNSKCHPSGCPHFKNVQVNTAFEGCAVEFAVSDTGVGMSSDALKNLFQPYSQVGSSTARLYGGTGLGLFIVRQLTHLMGGSITATSVLGSGSVFTGRLFLRCVLTPPNAALVRESIASGPAPLALFGMPYKYQPLLDPLSGAPVAQRLTDIVTTVPLKPGSGTTPSHVLTSTTTTTTTKSTTLVAAPVEAAAAAAAAADPNSSSATSRAGRMVSLSASSNMTSSVSYTTLTAAQPLTVSVSLVTAMAIGAVFGDQLKAAAATADQVSGAAAPSHAAVAAAARKSGRLASSKEREEAKKKDKSSPGSTPPAPAHLSGVDCPPLPTGAAVASASGSASAAASPATSSTSASTSASTSPATSGKPTVWIIAADDHSVNRKVIGRMLRDLYLIDFAETGKEVLDLMERNYRTKRYATILMDAHMPEMDGVAASRELRARGYTLPIIAVTANVMSHDKQQYANAGMNETLSKPFKANDLISMLRQFTTPTASPGGSPPATAPLALPYPYPTSYAPTPHAPSTLDVKSPPAPSPMPSPAIGPSVGSSPASSSASSVSGDADSDAALGFEKQTSPRRRVVVAGASPSASGSSPPTASSTA